VLVTAVLVGPDWSSVAHGLLVPTVPELRGEGLTWTIALMGGVGGTLTILCYGYWIRETGRQGPEAIRVSRLDLGVGYLVTALFGVAMVIIGSTVQIEGSGATLVVRLADRLQQTLGGVGRWVFLVGAWGAVFSSLLGVWQAVPYIFADTWRLLRRGPGHPTPGIVDTASAAYRGFQVALATVPLVGLLVSFREVQKLYSVVGAGFMPVLAVALLFLNGKRSWVGENRNRRSTVAVLVGILLFFVLAGVMQVHNQLLG
jgi:Mn2+/Fe2+ NRAMP family transporter